MGRISAAPERYNTFIRIFDLVHTSNGPQGRFPVTVYNELSPGAENSNMFV